MSEVAAASRAVHLGPHHQIASIDLGAHGGIVDRLPEARPAGSALELRLRREQLADRTPRRRTSRSASRRSAGSRTLARCCDRAEPCSGRASARRATRRRSSAQETRRRAPNVVSRLASHSESGPKTPAAARTPTACRLVTLIDGPSRSWTPAAVIWVHHRLTQLRPWARSH